MPPKAKPGAPSKKTEQKKKEKVIEVRLKFSYEVVYSTFKIFRIKHLE